jgi:dTDP-4-dehydrorhamnose 3,5-epimerase
MEIPDVVLIEPQVWEDERGFFVETYKYPDFKKNGIDYTFVQDNHSKSGKGVLRGLHYQLNLQAQGKLIRVVKGSMFDVAVDMRKESPYYAKWAGCILSDKNRRMLFVPPGFAHGFCTLSDTAEVMYKCTNVYSPEHERGIIWNDPEIGIEWPIKNPILSEKDAGFFRRTACEGISGNIFNKGLEIRSSPRGRIRHNEFSAGGEGGQPGKTGCNIELRRL